MRPDSSITEIKGIGEKTKKLFEKMDGGKQLGQCQWIQRTPYHDR